jgi:SAM-dependent methyltransferase
MLLSTADQTSKLFRDYLSNYDEIAEDDLAESIQGEDYLRIQNERLFGYLGDVRGLDVCDLGIGQGLMLDHLARAGAASVTGIDIALPYLRPHSGDDRVRVLLANAENLPFRDEFDLMVASDILEHVLNVADFLLSAHRALRTSGRLAVKVPYKEDLTQYARSRGCRYRFVHLRNFTRSSLRNLLDHSGFEIERLILDGFHRYRLRRIYRRPVIVDRVSQRIVARLFTSDTALHAAGNRVGTALFRPAELTAIARKH